MKKCLPVSVFVLALALTPFAIASAHTLKVDGNVGAIMHTDPDDEPVANATSTVNVQFADKVGDFDASEYTTIAALTLGTTTVYQTDLFTLPGASDDTASFPYSFPTPGEYTLAITGKPVADAQAFTLSYAIDVAAGSPSAAAAPSFWRTHGLHVILVGILILVLFVLFVKGKLDERRRKTA